MPNPVNSPNCAADFSLFPLIATMPDDIKGELLRNFGRERRRVLCAVNWQLRRWVENSIDQLIIHNHKILDSLKDSTRFKNCRTVYFDRPVKAERLVELRASIVGIETSERGLKDYDNAIIDVLLERSWKTLKLGKWQQRRHNRYDRHNGFKIDIDIARNILKKSESTLTYLNLDNRFAGDAAAEYLSKARNLQVLSLRKSCIHDVGIKALAGLPCLKKLVISGASMHAGSILALLHSKSLTSLKLNEILFGPAETPVWEALSQNQSLTRLSLKTCFFHGQPEAMTLLVEALAKNSRISKLSLSGNVLTDTELNYLDKMPALSDLDVSNELLQGRHISIAANSRITRLNLSGNRISTEGLNALIKPGTLKSLSVFNCALNEKSLIALWNANGLTKIEVGANFDSEMMLRALACPASPSLLKVSVKSSPELSLSKVCKLVSNGTTASAMKFRGTYVTNDFHSSTYCLYGIEELEEMRYAHNFHDIRQLSLLGSGFNDRKLKILPKSIENLTLCSNDVMTVNDFEPLGNLPFLSELRLNDVDIDDKGLEFLLSLESLLKLQLLDVELNKHMKMLIDLNDRIEIIVSYSSPDGPDLEHHIDALLLDETEG